LSIDGAGVMSCVSWNFQVQDVANVSLITAGMPTAYDMI